MKRQKEQQTIVVGVNSLVSTTQPAYSNHCQMWYRLGRAYPDYRFVFMNPPRMSIDRMRNLTAKTALEVGASHLLFIDDDVLIPMPFDFLRKLLACKADIAAADVIVRGWPFNHMLFKMTKDKQGLNIQKNVPKVPGVYPYDAVGFSCCLISTDLLKKVPQPYFVTGITNTEDIYFCVKARVKVPECTIVADTSIKCGHILSAEIIEPDNLVNYRKYWKKQFNPQEDQDEKVTRGLAYYNLVRGSLNASEIKETT